MKVNDFSFLSAISLRVLKTLKIDDLPKLKEANISDLSSLLTLITGYEISGCIYSSVKLESGIDMDMVFSGLYRCWINSMVELCERISPSKEVELFIKTYLSRHAIAQVVRSIKYLQGSIAWGHVPVIACLDTTYNSVRELLNVIKSCKEINAKVFTEVLHRYVDSKIVDLDVNLLESELLSNYWRKLIEYGSLLRPQYNLSHALTILKDFNVVDALIKRMLFSIGELGSEIRKKYDYLIFKRLMMLALGGDVSNYDLLSNITMYKYLTSLLKYSPLSFDILLYYLLIKEWESVIASFMVYSLINGLSNYMIKVLNMWVDLYAGH